MKNKTIEDQGGKKMKVLEEPEKQLIKSSGEKESLILLKPKEVSGELAIERTDETQYLSKRIIFNNLIYYFNSKNVSRYL